jgi:hypothetical protein
MQQQRVKVEFNQTYIRMMLVFFPILLGVWCLQAYMTGIKGVDWIGGVMYTSAKVGDSVFKGVLFSIIPAPNTTAMTTTTTAAVTADKQHDGFFLFLGVCLVVWAAAADGIVFAVLAVNLAAILAGIALFFILLMAVAAYMPFILCMLLVNLVYIGIPFGIAYFFTFWIPEQRLGKATKRFGEDVKWINETLNTNESLIIGQKFDYDRMLCATTIDPSCSRIPDSYIKQLGQEIRRFLPANKHLPGLVMEYAVEIHAVCLYSKTECETLIYCGQDAEFANRLVSPSSLFTTEDYVAIGPAEFPDPLPLWDTETQRFVMSSGEEMRHRYWLLHVQCTLNREKLCKLID